MYRLPYKGGTVRISSGYGNRILNGYQDFHTGLDLVGSNKQVVSVCSGTVMQSRIVTDPNNKTSEWGNYISILGDDGKWYYYCHLMSRLALPSQRVMEGTIIGIEGSTGKSTGSHLHFEVRESATGTGINPCDIIGVYNTVGSVYEVKDESAYWTTPTKVEVKADTSSNEQIVKNNNPSDYAYEHVLWALDNNIMYGDGKGNLNLKEPCTREQMITFIHRAVNYILNEIGDDGK